MRDGGGVEDGAMTHRRVVLDDVARAAGVSRSTASRALVDDPRISEPTRLAVKTAALDLRYVPNAAARSLRARRTRILGLLLANFSDPVHGEIAAAFEQEALAAGYRVLFAAGLQDANLERKALSIFTEHAADGVAMVSSVLSPNEAQARVRPDRLIIVQPDHRQVDGYRGPLVPGVIMTDDGSGVEAVVDHLVATGHRDIAYVGSGGLASTTVHSEAVGRALAKHGMVHQPDRFPSEKDAWRESHALAAQIAADRPDALICYEDVLALALMDALRALGVRTPEDVSIVGFDGIPFAEISNPRLTTVITPLAELGRRAAVSLIEAIHTGVMPAAIVLPVELAVRESTRPRAAASGSA
jgi:LacI family transcriptional regulator/LacI family repressor for deo operon, udp, cdd, tsx, nupC, and nupG